LILNSCGSISIIIARPLPLRARIKPEGDLELSPKLFGHEAIKDKINGRVYESHDIPNFSPWVVLAPQELWAVPSYRGKKLILEKKI
jgi:hypothetical protein